MKAASIAVSKKALDVVIMNIGRSSIICDYFVIASAKTSVHTRAIAESIARELKEAGLVERRIEGLKEGAWILLDYGSVVVHIFLEELRKFYDLEDRWSTIPMESL